jgi:hypothetical protein
MNENILKIPYVAVKEDWNLLQQFLKMKGNPRYIIIGDVDLRSRHDISDLGNLVGVDGYFNLNGCKKIKTLGKLKKVGGYLTLAGSSIESLGELEFVEGFFSLWGCKKIKTLGKLKKVGDFLYLGDSSIESLGELEFVGEDIYINDTEIPYSEINKVNVVGEIYR